MAMQLCVDMGTPADLGQEDLVELALLPGWTLEGVASVHEGISGHASCPPPFNRW